MPALHLGSEGYATDGTDGRVGIGTAAPNAPLTVVGGLAGVYYGANDRGIAIDPGVTAGVVDIYGDYIGSGSEPKLHLSTYSQKATANGITIDTGGKVGIGTTSPGANLDVRGSITASSGKASGVNLEPTLATSASADELVGLRIKPSFTINHSVPKEIGISVESESGMSGDMINLKAAGNDTQPPVMRLRKSRGSLASPSVVQVGDYLGVIGFEGYATGIGDSRAAGAYIVATVDGTPGSSYVPTKLVLQVREESGLLDAVTIKSSGNVGIGTTSPATSAKLELSSTTGALLLTRLSTTQRDALTAVAGMVIFNTTTGTFQGCTVGGGTPTWVNL